MIVTATLTMLTVPAFMPMNLSNPTATVIILCTLQWGIWAQRDYNSPKVTKERLKVSFV